MAKRAQAAKYITELSSELADIANANRLPTLEYMLRVAAMEAKLLCTPPISVRASEQSKMQAAA